MPELDSLYFVIERLVPLDCMKARFMQQALFALLLLAPLSAAMGVHVINLRMSFFADAISHSAFAGVAFALLFSLDPNWGMLLLGLLLGLLIMASQRRGRLSSDTIIGVYFSGVVAIGLALLSREPSLARNMQQYLYGDILSIGDDDIRHLIGLFCLIMIFQIFGFNRMLFIAVNSTLAKTHGVQVALWQYVFGGLLSLFVVYSVRALGVFLVTAMLILPAAAARNISRSAGLMFWFSVIFSLFSSVLGLYISSTDWAHSATGPTIVLVAFSLFLVCALWGAYATERASS